tara:strand:- start:2840 stop:3058 length:219 start_codon:yes stop_codon:yes gene_type:complete
MKNKKKTSKQILKQFMKHLKEDVGNIIKDHDTGIYFRTAGNGKLQTSLKIHTEAGGDSILFKAWADAQKKPH